MVNLTTLAILAIGCLSSDLYVNGIPVITLEEHNTKHSSDFIIENNTISQGAKLFYGEITLGNPDVSTNLALKEEMKDRALFVTAHGHNDSYLLATSVVKVAADNEVNTSPRLQSDFFTNEPPSTTSKSDLTNDGPIRNKSEIFNKISSIIHTNNSPPPNITRTPENEFGEVTTPTFRDIIPPVNPTLISNTNSTTISVTSESRDSTHVSDIAPTTNVTLTTLSAPTRHWKLLPAAVWADQVARYASPSITVIGIIGNAMSLLVLGHQHLGHAPSSFSVYLISLSVADVGSLVTWAYRWTLLVLRPRPMSHSECRFNVGLKYAFRMAGYFFVVVLTVDRLQPRLLWPVTQIRYSRKHLV